MKIEDVPTLKLYTRARVYSKLALPEYDKPLDIAHPSSGVDGDFKPLILVGAHISVIE